MAGTSRALDQIARDLVVEAGVAKAAVVAVAERRTGSFRVSTGAAGSLGQSPRRAAPCSTIFDLASVTKPFIAVTLLRLEASDRLRLDSAIGDLLAEARGTPCQAVTLEQLLSHRAGLDAHRSLFAPLVAQRPFDRRSALTEAARARRPECRDPAKTDGFPPLYSDLGYLLAGEAASVAVGRPLDQLVADEVAAPLGLEVGSMRGLLAQDPRVVRRIAPTEVIHWRGGELRGVVHDENAWALAGHGLAGQAGLFGTAEAVARFGAAVLDALSGRDGGFLTADCAARLVRSRPGGTLLMGFDGKSSEGSSAGERSGPRTFGHLGFTGTSLWCDPDRDVVAVLLTNRVNPTREHVAIRSARPRVHDALFELAAAAAISPGN